MERTLGEKVEWILNKLDMSGKLSREFKNGNLYISDETTNTSYLYDANNPEHAEFKKHIDHLNGLAKGIADNVVFHVVVGNVDMMGTECLNVNYLMVSEDDEYYEDNWNHYGFVMAFVDNKKWDIQEAGSIKCYKAGGIIIRTA